MEPSISLMPSTEPTVSMEPSISLEPISQLTDALPEDAPTDDAQSVAPTSSAEPSAAPVISRRRNNVRGRA